VHGTCQFPCLAKAAISIYVFNALRLFCEGAEKCIAGRNYANPHTGWKFYTVRLKASDLGGSATNLFIAGMRRESHEEDFMGV
jgi:hypothetical protein